MKKFIIFIIVALIATITYCGVFQKGADYLPLENIPTILEDLELRCDVRIYMLNLLIDNPPKTDKESKIQKYMHDLFDEWTKRDTETVKALKIKLDKLKKQ